MHVINLGVYCLHIKVELFSYHNCSICIFCIAIYVLYFKCTGTIQYILPLLFSHTMCNTCLNIYVVNWLATLMWCMHTCGLVLCS